MRGGGHCLVNLRKVQQPKELGGLGVLDLELFGRALQLRCSCVGCGFNGVIRIDLGLSWRCRVMKWIGSCSDYPPW
jgi:hypothetical protein